MEEVKDLLQAWELPELIPIFQSNALNIQSLAALSYDEIKELIPQMGPRALFMRCYKSWKTDFTTASTIDFIDTSKMSITDIVFPLLPEEIEAYPETPDEVNKLTEPPSMRKTIENDKDFSQSKDKSRHLSEVLPSDLYEKVCNTLDIPITPQTREETSTVPDLLDSSSDDDSDYEFDARVTLQCTNMRRIWIERQIKCLKRTVVNLISSRIYQKKNSQSISETQEKLPRRYKKEPLLSYRTTLYVNREMDSDTDVEGPSDDEDTPNIHWEFLKKPEREQVTWPTHYLQPERDDEKTLVKKADDLTDRIAQEFCDYMKDMGGNQQSQLFTPKAVKELFQIEFDTHVARGLRVVPKELPSVGEKIAQVTGNPEKSRIAALEREISKDIEAERPPDKVMGFGTTLPGADQYRAPRNDTENLWRSARHVPKDLVTLKTVWEGITNLRSVKEYCLWMIHHPEFRRAPYLCSLGLFDPAVLRARMSYELKDNVRTPPVSSTHDDAPAPIDHLRKRLSQLTENN